MFTGCFRLQKRNIVYQDISSGFDRRIALDRIAKAVGSFQRILFKDDIFVGSQAACGNRDHLKVRYILDGQITVRMDRDIF